MKTYYTWKSQDKYDNKYLQTYSPQFNENKINNSTKEFIFNLSNQQKKLNLLDKNYKLISNNYERYMNFSHHPLTKLVDQMVYELPSSFSYSKISNGNVGACAPEFLKVFSDVCQVEGNEVIFDCVLLGIPRPRVFWLFNDVLVDFHDVFIENTADLCRLTIPRLQFHHYGVYTVIAENEAGRVLTNATLIPNICYNYKKIKCDVF